LGYFIFASICITAPSLHALEITPFNTKNQSPIIQVYGLPAAGNAILLSPGQKEFHVMLDYASNYVDNANVGEHIVLDGELPALS